MRQTRLSQCVGGFRLGDRASLVGDKRRRKGAGVTRQDSTDAVSDTARRASSQLAARSDIDGVPTADGIETLGKP